MHYFVLLYYYFNGMNSGLQCFGIRCLYVYDVNLFCDIVWLQIDIQIYIQYILHLRNHVYADQMLYHQLTSHLYTHAVL